MRNKCAVAQMTSMNILKKDYIKFLSQHAGKWNAFSRLGLFSHRDHVDTEEIHGHRVVSQSRREFTEGLDLTNLFGLSRVISVSGAFRYHISKEPITKKVVRRVMRHAIKERKKEQFKFR